MGSLGFIVWVAVLSSFVLSIELPPAAFSNLNSEEFRKRETAQSELLTWARERPEQAMDELFRQSRVADDPEVRERCLAVLRELVSDEYLREGEGYIGIRMQDELANVPDDPKPRAVIRVIQVVDDSAAEKAGIRINDLIVGIGDQIWREGGASLPFTGVIRQLKPNSKITLKILRDGKLMDTEVKLGRRPLMADNLFFMDPQTDLDAAERAAKEAYFRRWLEQRKSRE